MVAYILHQSVDRSDRTRAKGAARQTGQKEIIMRIHGQTTTWGTHIGVGRAGDGKGWYKHGCLGATEPKIGRRTGLDSKVPNPIPVGYLPTPDNDRSWLALN